MHYLVRLREKWDIIPNFDLNPNKNMIIIYFLFLLIIIRSRFFTSHFRVEPLKSKISPLCTLIILVKTIFTTLYITHESDK